MSKYKVGDEFTSKGSGGRRQIIGVKENEGITWYWVDGSADGPWSLSEEMLESTCSKVEQFFKAGRKYKMGGIVYDVKEIYQAGDDAGAVVFYADPTLGSPKVGMLRRSSVKWAELVEGDSE